MPEHLIVRVVFFGRRIAAALPRMQRYSLIALVKAQAMGLRWLEAAGSAVID
jgi:hypothetical protein